MIFPGCVHLRRPVSIYICGRGALAQLGERLVCNQEVAGSIPVRSIQYWKTRGQSAGFSFMHSSSSGDFN